MDKFVQVLVVSDTHGQHGALAAIARNFGGVKYVFHLGDYIRDAVYLSDHMKNCTVVNVKGNCDMGSDCPEFEEISIKGQKLILTHGHLLKAKYGQDRLLYYAEEHEAQAILFGHTHVPVVERRDGVWLINPGSAGEPRDGRKTVALLLVGEVGIVPKILSVDSPGF